MLMKRVGDENVKQAQTTDVTDRKTMIHDLMINMTEETRMKARVLIAEKCLLNVLLTYRK